MDTPDSTTLKRCSRCGEWLPFSQFHVDRSKKSGVGAQCKSCTLERKRCWRAENVERARETGRQWREKNADKKREYDQRWQSQHRDSVRASVRRWHEANQEKAQEGRQRYRETNPEKVKESSRRWAREHPDVLRTNYHRRRARIRAVGGSFTTADLAAIRAAQTDKRGRLICTWCHKPISDTPHLDHWIPLARGGTNDPGNLRYLHAICNLKKHAKLPTETGRLI